MCFHRIKMEPHSFTGHLSRPHLGNSHTGIFSFVIIFLYPSLTINNIRLSETTSSSEKHCGFHKGVRETSLWLVIHLPGCDSFLRSGRNPLSLEMNYLSDGFPQLPSLSAWNYSDLIFKKFPLAL